MVRLLSVINKDESEKWNSIVKSFEDFDVYYLHEYSQAFDIHGDGDPLLFYYENVDIRALNVVMKRDIALDRNFSEELSVGKYYDISTPYGYGGFLIEGEITEESLKLMSEEYSLACMKAGIVSEFVRFHPILKNDKELSGIYDITKLSQTITLNLTSKGDIWSNLLGKNRNVIRKSRKLGVEIFWGRSPDLIDEFIKMYNATMDKDNAKDYYYFGKDFYSSILNDLRYNSMIFYAKYNGEIIAMSMILFANNQMHYHLSASIKEYQSLAATNYLLYEAACWGCENGYKTFHLGGGLGSQEDSLFKFKKAFNKNSDTIFSTGKKIINIEKYNELIDIRNKQSNWNPNTDFFPKYRAVK